MELELELKLSVLIYFEEDTCIAHCLEMDLKGYGTNKQEAFHELRDLVFSQIDFALFKNEPGLIYHPAEKAYFDIFNNIKKEQLKSFPLPPTVNVPAYKHLDNYTIGTIPLPLVSSIEKSSFVPAAI